MRPVTVRIEQLALKGIRYEDRHAIAQALQERLAHVLSQPGMAERLSRMGDVPYVRAGRVTIASDARPQQVGIEAANGIGRGLSR